MPARRSPGVWLVLAGLAASLVLLASAQAHVGTLGNPVPCGGPPASSCSHRVTTTPSDHVTWSGSAVPAGKDRILVVVIQHVEYTEELNVTRVASVLFGGLALAQASSVHESPVPLDPLPTAPPAPDGSLPATPSWKGDLALSTEIWYAVLGSGPALPSAPIQVTWFKPVAASLATALSFGSVDQVNPIKQVATFSDVSGQSARAVVPPVTAHHGLFVGGAAVSRHGEPYLSLAPLGSMAEMDEASTASAHGAGLSGTGFDGTVAAVGVQAVAPGWREFGWSFTDRSTSVQAPKDFSLGVVELKGHPDVGIDAPCAAPAACPLAWDLAEDAGDPGITVSLSASYSSPLTVGYSLQTPDGTASIVDESGTPGTLVFAPGETTKRVPLRVVDNDLDDGTRIATLRLDAVDEGHLGDATLAILTLRDDDLFARFAKGSDAVPESAGSVRVEVVLTEPRADTVQVPYTVAAGGGAADGADVGLSSGTLTFPSGATSASFAITVVQDGADEPDESLEVALGIPDASSVRRGEPKVFRLTIEDDDEPLPAPEPAVTATTSEVASPASTPVVSSVPSAPEPAPAPADPVAPAGAATLPAATPPAGPPEPADPPSSGPPSPSAPLLPETASTQAPTGESGTDAANEAEVPAGIGAAPADDAVGPPGTTAPIPGPSLEPAPAPASFAGGGGAATPPADSGDTPSWWAGWTPSNEPEPTAASDEAPPDSPAGAAGPPASGHATGSTLVASGSIRGGTSYDITERLGLAVRGTTAVFSWKPVPGAAGYQIWWGTAEEGWAGGETLLGSQASVHQEAVANRRYKLTFFLSAGLDQGHATGPFEAALIPGWDTDLFLQVPNPPSDVAPVGADTPNAHPLAATETDVEPASAAADEGEGFGSAGLGAALVFMVGLVALLTVAAAVRLRGPSGSRKGRTAGRRP